MDNKIDKIFALKKWTESVNNFDENRSWVE